MISDIHTNLFNLRRLLNKYRNHTVICLGDIVNLWDKNISKLNHEIIDFFIKKNIICLKGNHDEWVGGNQDLHGISDEQSKYLVNLPLSLTIELPDNKKYQFYHYRPNDFWSLETPDKVTFSVFCNVYGANDNVDAIVIGHLHSSYELRFENHNRKLIGLGALKEGHYALLTENGIQHLSL